MTLPQEVDPTAVSEPSKSYAKHLNICPLCHTEVVSFVSREKGGRPRQFHRECKVAWDMLRRLEWFVERAHFDSSEKSLRAASRLRRRLWVLANRLNRHGRPRKS